MKTIQIKYFDFFVNLGAKRLEDGIYEIILSKQLIYISKVKGGLLNGVSKSFNQDDIKTGYRLGEIFFHKDNIIEGECLSITYEDNV